MAQSTKARSPLGVNFFWDKGHQPEIEWEKWLATVKLAIMVKKIYKLTSYSNQDPKMKILITQQSHTTNQHYLTKQPPKKGKENKETSKDVPIGKTHAKT